jgi:signal recognition particle subunit SRP54
MKEMLKMLGQGSTSFLSKLPGFKQLSQLSQMKNMNLDDLFGGPMGGQPGAPALAGGGMPQIPGMPTGPMAGFGGAVTGGPGPSMPSSKRLTAKERNKKKAKRKRSSRRRR